MVTQPTINHKAQGKKNRASGAAFERRVRKDLEKNEWIVDKWSNNVRIRKEYCEGCSFKCYASDCECICHNGGRLEPAKHKFRGPGIPMAMGTGFPDFIAFKRVACWNCVAHNFGKCGYKVIGVEVKSNGYLTKEEKEKCQWYLDNNIFTRILIASKGKKRGEIVYKEFGK